jgi:hypothetical protein
MPQIYKLIKVLKPKTSIIAKRRTQFLFIFLCAQYEPLRMSRRLERDYRVFDSGKLSQKIKEAFGSYLRNLWTNPNRSANNIKIN